MKRDYELRKEACILLEQARLEKKGIKTEQAVALASHSVHKTLWILRNKACLTRSQALETLENRQVEKRSKKKILYFWQLGNYSPELEYDAGLTDRLILLEAIASYCTRKHASYIWYARQSKKLGVKPRELIELVNRYIYSID
jgi:hypothetical protein